MDNEEDILVYIPPKKKKRHHTGLIILIVFLVIILLIVAAVAAVVGLVIYELYDDTTNETNYDNGQSLNDLFEDLIFDALAVTEDEETGAQLFELSISEQQLSEIIHTELNAAFDTSSFPLNNYYVDFEGDNMTLVVEVEISFFKTRLILDTTLYTDVDEQDYKNSMVCFGIDNIQIGKLGGLETVTFDILDAFNIDIGEYIDGMADYGISLGFDRENLMLTYKFSDLVNDIFSLVNLGEIGEYLEAFLDVMLQENLFRIDIKNDDALSFNVDISNFIGDNLNDTYLDMSGIRDNYLNVLVDNGQINSTEDVNAVYDLLVDGYENIGSDEQQIVNNMDLSYINIDDPSAEGLPYAREKYIDDLGTIINNIVDSDSFFITQDTGQTDEEGNEIYERIGVNYSGDIGAISFSDLSSYIGSMGINGLGYFMYHNEEIRYIGVNNVGIVYDQDSELASIFVTFDYNGYIIPITLDFSLKAFEIVQNDYVIGLEYNGNSFGNYTMDIGILGDFIVTIEESVCDGKILYMNEGELILDLGMSEIVESFVVDSLLEDWVVDLLDDPTYSELFNFSISVSYAITSESIGVSYDIDLSDDLKELLEWYMGWGDYANQGDDGDPD